MKRTIGQRLVTASAELAIIVAGVLLALTADAWWESIQDRQEEERILTDLLGEFRVNAERLEFDIRQNERQRDRLVAYQAAVRGEVEIPSDSVATLLARAASNRFDPESGVLGSVMAGDQLALISDASLRRDLASWQARLDDQRTTWDKWADWAIATRQLLPEPGQPRSTVQESVLLYEVIFRNEIIRKSEELLESTHDVVTKLEAAAVGTPTSGS